jgi:hypothetical protein
MQPPPAPRARTARLLGAAVAVLALLAVVAFASRSGFGHSSQARPSPGYVSWAMTLFLILFVLMIPFAVWSYAVQTREQLAARPPFQKRVIRSLLFLASAMLLGLVFVYAKRHLHFSFSGIQQHNGSAGLGANGGKRLAHHRASEPTFKWPVLWAVIGLLAAVGAGYWWSLRLAKRRMLGAPFQWPTIAEEVAATISDAIDDLEAEPDARRAVVAAYARMEATFARNGLARRSSETPVEYLRRILLGLTSRGDAVRRLTALFEQAKFSSHVIDGQMKSEAIASLREIRDDLQGAPA